MRRTVAALAVLATVTTGGGPAAAEDLDVAGLGCGFTSVSDPQQDVEQNGTIDGGPVAVTGAEPGATVELVCTLQTTGWRHLDPDTAAASGSGPGVAAVPPTFVKYPNSTTVLPYVCSEVRVTTSSGVRTLYWDDYDERWAATPDVGCMKRHPVAEPVPDGALDALLCPVLAVASPPQGDVPGIWDCPPYDA